MPTVPFQSYLRLTHTGVARTSLLINDLDTGYENQNRKSPVYVPVGGFIDVPLTSRSLYSAMQGTIAGFARQGFLEVTYSSYARDGDNLGGAGGIGITLNAGVAQNIRRLGNVLSFVINSGLDTSGFIAGDRMTVTGLVGAFAALNGTYLISAFTKSQDFAGGNPLAAIISVPSVGVNIPAALHAPGVLLTLPDGMTTHLYVSTGNAGGLGADVRTYFAGDMVVTGTVDPTAVVFSPVDLAGATPNTLGVDINTGLLTFYNEVGIPVPLSGGATPLAEQLIVSPAGGQFSSVAAAIATIGDASALKPYQVTVGPGVYNEPPFTVPAYVTVSGAGPEATVLKTTSNLAHFISGSPNSEVSSLSIEGPSGAGFACIDYQGTGNNPFRVFNVELAAGYYGIWAHPAASGIILCDEVFNYSQGRLHTFIYASGRAILRGVICAYRDDAAKGNTYGFRAEGANVQLYLDGCIYKDAAGTYGFYADGGGQMRLTNCNVAAAGTGIYVGPNGATRMDAISCVVRPVVVNHLDVDSVTAEVLFSGVASQSKISVAAGANFVANFADPAGGASEGQVNIGEFYLGDTTGNQIPVRDYLWYSASTGLAEGGEVTRNIAGGLKLDVAEGECFISTGAGLGVLELYWNDITLDMTDNSLAWVIVNNSGSVVETLATPDPHTSVVLAQVVTRGGQVVFLGKGTVTQTYQPISELQEYRYLSNGPRALSGIATSANVAPLKLNIDGGSFYIGSNHQDVGPGTAVTFTAWYRSNAPGNPWVAVTGQTEVDDEQFNDIAGGGGLVAIPGGESTGHVTYIASTEDGPEYHVVYGQMTDAVVANITLPTPPDWLKYTAARSGMVVVLKGAGVITQVNDERQFGGATGTAGGGGVTDHALLAGLAVGNDHPQYQLRAERDVALGYPTLTAASKLQAGQVPFTATAPPDVTDGLASAGAGTEVARQNHVHFHGNLDSIDGLLAALHATAVAGVKPGFISAADQSKLDNLITNAVPDTRTLTAGNGLSGGGDLTVNRSFAVLAEDASIVVGAGGVKVGILQSDASHGNRGGGGLHAVVISGGAAGFMSGVDKTKLDNLITNAVPDTRTLTAGNGLSGGGDLSANRSFAVAAHVDGSIVVGVGGVQVGVLATDAQHGNRNGGALHAVAVAGVSAGFISAASQSKLDGLPASAVPTTRNLTAGNGLTGGGDLSADRTFTVQAGDASISVGAGGVSVGILQSDASHGNRGGGALHSVATGATAGFMSAASQSKLDNLITNAVPDTRTLTAGNGLTGGGDLTVNRSFAVLAEDASIVVGAGGVKVGILQSDASHGNRGGGALHSVATGATAGFMSAADKTKLDGVAAGATVNIYGNNYQTAISTARTTYNTTTAFQNKVTLTTPALTGTYEVMWHAVLDGSATNQNVEAQLLNTTDAAIVGVVQVMRPSNAAERYSVGGFAEVTFTGAAKTFDLQYRTANTGSTVGIADARIKIIRVA